MDQSVAPEPLITPSATRILFRDYRGEFLRLVFRGALLELITIGFYRFWLATDIRRQLWRSTWVDGDTLEYTGLAKELFFGALLALAIFAPVYLTYFLIGVEAERYQAFASTPFLLFFYLFSQFALYRARRYRMTRTIWRGVRFWMTGSGWDYAWRSAALMAVVLVTFGLALPWRDAILERFKMRHSHYGDLQGRFDGTGWEFFKKGVWLWLLMVVFLALFVVLIVVSFQPPAANLPVSGKSAAVLSFLLSGIIMVGAPFFYAAFKAIQWRWWISGIRFADVSFSSNIRASRLFGIYWKIVGWFALIWLALGISAGGIAAIAALWEGPGGMTPEKMAIVSQQWQFLLPSILCYVVAVLMITAVMRIYLIHDLIERLADSAVIHNIEAAQNVAARGAAANAVGEGLANSLDIFGF